MHLIHRGIVNKSFKENLLKSFKQSFKKGYGIETDIHATKDNQFICFHDFTLRRIFKKNLSVKNLNYSKIKEISTKLGKPVPLLKDLLKIQPNNEAAQSDLAQAYEKSGRDPLDVYKNRFDNNPDNVSYGLDYADKLIVADRPDDAIDVLQQVVDVDPSSKVAFRKLAQAYDSDDRLKDAARTYERLFKLDPRDFRVAIKISDVQELGDVMIDQLSGLFENKKLH